MLQLVIHVGIFVVVVLAASRIGTAFSRLSLPLITGFLATGFLVGPALGQQAIIDEDAVTQLGFVNQIALAIIALAAGNELVLKEFRSRFQSIAWGTVALVVTTFSFGSLAMYMLTDWVPVLKGLPTSSKLALSILSGVILVARSPSSAIAIVDELRAKGPLTNTILGVTVIMDSVVIVMFAIGAEFAHAMIGEINIGATFVGLLLLEFAVAGVLGWAVWKLISLYMSLRIHRPYKIVLVLTTGFGVFVFADWFKHWTQLHWSTEIHFEPLLICMIAGLLITNRSPHRAEFSRVLEETGPPVYLAFFTLTGASIEIDVLLQTWPIAITLVLIRLVTVFIGSFIGGTIAGDPIAYRRITWMGFVTQAGVGIGLAREMAGQAEFSPWGSSLATILISVIIINQVIGPPMFKWTVSLAGEVRLRATSLQEEGSHTALIFGNTSGPPLMLATQLISRGWDVKLVTLDDEETEETAQSGVEVVSISEISLESLEAIDTGSADVLISLLSDKNNLQVCELNHDRFGIEKIVVRLVDSDEAGKRWHDQGVLVVEPKTSMVSLLEHFVTSPTATSILLGFDPEQDVVEVVLRDPSLVGVPIRDLKLPLDALILSVTRDGHTLISHGYTDLELGDQLTVVGPPNVLPDAVVYFDR